MKDTFDSLYYYKYLFTGIPKEFACSLLEYSLMKQNTQTRSTIKYWRTPDEYVYTDDW